MRQTPPRQQIEASLTRARAAANAARQLRLSLRRATTPGGGHREEEIADAVSRCASAARPIRRYIGMLAAHPELEPYDDRLREVSQSLTYERRLLRKMRR